MTFFEPDQKISRNNPQLINQLAQGSSMKIFSLFSTCDLVLDCKNAENLSNVRHLLI